MPDIAALVTPPLLLDSTGAPANGDIYVRLTAPVTIGGGIATRAQAKGAVRDGNIQALNGSAFEIPVTPAGVALEIEVLLREERSSGYGPPPKHAIKRTVSVPDQSTVTWDELVDVIPVEEVTDYVTPAWVAVLSARVDEAIDAADVATGAKTDAEAAAASVAPGVAGGTATLDGSAKIPESQIPTRLSATTIASTITTPLGLKLDATTAATTYAAARSGVSAVQPFLKRLKRGASDVKLLVIGDSTGNETTEWVYLLAQDLAAKYPTHTVRWNLWNDTTKLYDTAVTIQTGSGSRILDVFNLSVAGWTASAPISAPFATGVAAIQPDLTLVSLGHNEANVTVYNGERGVLLARYLAVTESVTAACPKTGMVVIAQNPSRADSNQAIRADAYERIASLRGFGFIDVHQHFIDNGTPAGWYTDLVHPNATGSAQWAAVVAAHFVEAPGAAPLVRLPSSLLEPTENFLTNGTFADFTAATPAGWTSTNATTTKETGAGNKESKHNWSVKIVPTTAAASSISQAIGIPQTEALRGQWVTLAARVKIPSAVAGAGRISLTGANTGLNSEVTTTQTIGGFTWVTLTTFVQFNASNITVFLHGEVGSTGTGVAYFDRAILARGMFPRDVVAP